MTEGGGKAGIGHISRCISLCQAFLLRGCDVHLIVKPFLEGLDLTSLLKGVPNTMLDWVMNKEELGSLIDGCDIVLIDSYYCASELYEYISRNCKVAAFIDDNVRMDYPSGVIINGVVGADELEYRPRQGQDYLLGSEYAFLRKEFWDSPNKPLSTDILNIFVSFGGNDVGNLSTRLSMAILKKWPHLQVSVVVNNADSPDYNDLRGRVRLMDNLSGEQMRDTMASSDLGVSAAGQTTYELCRVGTPFVPVVTADNQKFSIAKL